MKKTNKTTVAVFAIAIALSAAAVFPSVTHSVLTAPKTAIQNFQLAQQQQKNRQELQNQSSLEEWDIVMTAAYNKDTFKEVQYGLKKENRSVEEWIGEELDQEETQRLIRNAADHGNLGAKYAVWNMDGNTTEGLLKISDYVTTEAKSPDALLYLSEALTWQASLTCDAAILDQGGKVEHLAGDSANQLERYSFLLKAKEQYQKDCRF